MLGLRFKFWSNPWQPLFWGGKRNLKLWCRPTNVKQYSRLQQWAQQHEPNRVWQWNYLLLASTARGFENLESSDNTAALLFNPRRQRGDDCRILLINSWGFQRSNRVFTPTCQPQPVESQCCQRAPDMFPLQALSTVNSCDGYNDVVSYWPITFSQTQNQFWLATRTSITIHQPSSQ